MKSTKKLITEALIRNALRESAVSSQDVAGYGVFLPPMLDYLYSTSLVSQIASVQPLSGPVGKVFATVPSYSGFRSYIDNMIYFDQSKSNPDLNRFFETSRLIAVAGSFPTPPNSLTIGADTVAVLYSEVITYTSTVRDLGVGTPTNADLASWGLGPADGPYNDLVGTATVMLVTGFDVEPAIGDSVVELGVPLIMVLANRTAIKKYFRKYSGDFSGLIDSTNYTNHSDEDQNAKYIDIFTKGIKLSTKNRKIASQLTVERLQDLQTLYGEDYTEIVGKIIAHEINAEIDMEVISFLREIAKPRPDINLTYSLGLTASTMLDMSSDLVTNINLAVEDIQKSIRRNRTMFVIADSTTIGYLKVNPWHVVPDTPDNDNPYRVGTIGKYPLFCDPFATDHYILVGYMYDSDIIGDAGLIFAPYLNQVHEFVDDKDMFQRKLLTTNRYAYCRHPQDTGTAVGDSDFFRIFTVSYTGETPLTPRDHVFDIPNLSKSILPFI